MWKITFFFTQWNFSWTETYYQSPSVPFSQLQAQCLSVAQARVGLNASQCVLTAIRIVSLNSPRQAQFLSTGTFASTGTFGGFNPLNPDQDSAPQFVALQVKFFGTAGGTSRRYVSGVPEGVISTQFGGRNLGVIGGMWTALTTWVASLANAGWSYRFNPQATKALALSPVTSAQFPSEIGLPFNTQILSAASPTPYKLYLTGFKKLNYRQFGLGGVYTVDPGSPGLAASVPPWTYYLRNTSQVAPANILQTGYASPLVYGYQGFTSSGGPAQTGYAVLSANHRKRGVSALALRGRSRSKP